MFTNIKAELAAETILIKMVIRLNKKEGLSKHEAFQWIYKQVLSMKNKSINYFGIERLGTLEERQEMLGNFSDHLADTSSELRSYTSMLYRDDQKVEL